MKKLLITAACASIMMSASAALPKVRDYTCKFKNQFGETTEINFQTLDLGTNKAQFNLKFSEKMALTLSARDKDIYKNRYLSEEDNSLQRTMLVIGSGTSKLEENGDLTLSNSITYNNDISGIRLTAESGYKKAFYYANDSSIPALKCTLNETVY